MIALRTKDKIIRRHLERINRNLGLADIFFENHKDLFSWVRPKAGTIAFPKLNSDENSFEFCERVIKNVGVMLLPSIVYDYDDKHFRFGFGRKNFPEALEALKRYISH